MKKYILLFLFMMPTAFAEVAVVVHPSNTSALDQDSISRLFLGKAKSFSNGTPAIPVSLKNDSDASKSFNNKVLGKSASQLKAYWSQLVFTGKGTPPREADNDAEVLKLVASNPNVIGFVSASSVDANVKVVGKF